MYHAFVSKSSRVETNEWHIQIEELIDNILCRFEANLLLTCWMNRLMGALELEHEWEHNLHCSFQ
jgi:hypothetical protein